MNIQKEEDHNSGQQNSFETIYQRRIDQLEQKVNKYCAEYDGLMNLLPIGNDFSSVLGFQKDFGQLSARIQAMDEKFVRMNQKQVDFDFNYWGQLVEDLQNVLQNNQKQLERIQKLQKQQQNEDDGGEQFSQSLKQKFKTHQDIIFSKLAQHRNFIDLKRHKQSAQNHTQLSRVIDQKLSRHFGPLHRQIAEIQEEIQICRLKIPLRQPDKFADFNHHRLMNEILELNGILQEVFSQCSTQEVKVGPEISTRIREIQSQIESLYYQIQGSKRKSLANLMTYHFVNPNFNHGINQLEKNVIIKFSQLQNNLNQLKQKYDLIQNYVSSH